MSHTFASFFFHLAEMCYQVGTRSGRDMVNCVNMCVVQLYWGAKSELGEVVTRLSQVYESAKRDAVTRLQEVGMETIAIGNTDVNIGPGQLIDILPNSSSGSRGLDMHVCKLRLSLALQQFLLDTWCDWPFT